MKGFLFVLAILIMLPFSVSAEEKVNVYLFKRNGCGYCEAAREFFNKLSEDNEYKNYFTLVEKEVSTSKQNANIMESVAKELNVNLGGVPFIVIGNQHYEGYDPNGSWDDNLKETIKKAYLNSDGTYKDIVAPYLNNTKDDNGAAITIVILLVAAAGIAFLVYMAKENTVENNEEIQSQKVLEEKKSDKIEKKPTREKTTTTKTSKTSGTKKSTTNTKNKTTAKKKTSTKKTNTKKK